MIAVLVLITSISRASAGGLEQFRESANARLQAQIKKTGARDAAQASVTARALAEQLGRLYLSASKTRIGRVEEASIHRVISAAVLWLEELSFDKGFIGNELTVRRVSTLLTTLLDESLMGEAGFEVAPATRTYARFVLRHGPRLVRMIRQIDPSFQGPTPEANSSRIDTIFERVADRLERGCEQAVTSAPTTDSRKPSPR